MSQSLKRLITIDLPREVAKIGILEFPNLEEWRWDAWRDDSLSLQGWKTPTLKKFVYSQVRPANDLVSFLRDQLQLQDLEIKNPRDVDSLVEASPFSFNLAKLNVRFFFRAISDSDNHSQFFLPFIQSQKQSLKVLILDSFVFGDEDFCQMMTLELEELELINVDYRSVTPTNFQNQTIKKLTMKLWREMAFNDGLTHVLEACHGVETLCIQGLNFSTLLVESIASTLSKLTNLDHSKVSSDFSLNGLNYIRVSKHFQPNMANEEN